MTQSLLIVVIVFLTLSFLCPIANADSRSNEIIKHFNEGNECLEQAKKTHDRKVLNLAIEAFTKAIKIDPDFVDAYNYRGVAYFLLRYYSRARRDFFTVLSIDPGNEFAKRNLELIRSERLKRRRR